MSAALAAIEAVVGAALTASAYHTYRGLRRRIERAEAAATRVDVATAETLDRAKAFDTLKSIAGHDFAICKHDRADHCLAVIRQQALEAMTTRTEGSGP